MTTTSFRFATMQHHELSQLELLANIDDLRQNATRLTEEPAAWDPMRNSQSLLKRVLDRVETLRIRLEAPLIVATFGGTGTGKSSLVNAIIGEECTQPGRQRPTTRRPVLITHRQTELSALGVPLEEVDIVQRDAEILHDIIILDCPDPDTNEGEAEGNNLERLRSLLPYCDVLLYVSTQQKYRSACVNDELATAAAGCRMIFVQTHANLDVDIRDDWRQTLAANYEVPAMFFVDSVMALQEQQQGRPPSGEMGRLIEFLTTQLGASARVQIRRANVVDLLQVGLTRSLEIMNSKRPQLVKLQSELVEQCEELSSKMANRLETELLSGRNLWERRLLSAVTQQWGVSPFSMLLSVYNGIGNILASMTLLRARSSLQMALLGAIQGARWIDNKRQELAADASLSKASQFGLDDALLKEAEIVIGGYVVAAGFQHILLEDQSLADLRRQAVVVEEQFVGSAAQHVDRVIQEQSLKNSGWGTRLVYETALSIYLAFVIYRVGLNFFYESFWLDEPLLTSDFYLAAGLFLLLWSGFLVMLFTRRLRVGLTKSVKQLISRMVGSKLSVGLFPDLEVAVKTAQRQMSRTELLLAETSELRHRIAQSTQLGSKRESDKPPLNKHLAEHV